MADLTALEKLLFGEQGTINFKIDGRSTLSTLQYLLKYTELVPFTELNVADKQLHTWAEVFFMAGNNPEKLSNFYQNRSLTEGELLPVQSLLLTFLEMLETPRALLNFLPNAHRELYYSEMLGLNKRAAEPAKVVLSFELMNTYTEVMIPKNTLFAAGQDINGVPIEFSLDKALLSNHAIWTDLRYCWSPEEHHFVSNIAYDGAQQIEWPEGGVRLFEVEPNDRTVILGRMLESAMFLTEEEVTEFVIILSSAVDPSLVTLYEISGKDKWIKLHNDNTNSSLSATLTFSLVAEVGLIAAPEDLDGLTLQYPALRLGFGEQRALPEVVDVIVNGSAVPSEDLKQYAMCPFGYCESEPLFIGAELYMGFTDIQPGQTLSLYWKLQGAKPTPMIWQYLDNQNRWASLDANIIDDTLGLFRSGLWSAILPGDASSDSLAMPSGRYWIRAIMENIISDTGISSYPFVFGIATNGMTATMVGVSNVDDISLSQPVPANTINQPIIPITGLSSVTQPWPSWGARVEETTDEFFVRSMQRISHRNRGVTWRDMVALLKQNFSSVYDVAIPAPIKQTYIPASVEQWLVVVPKSEDKDNEDTLRPKFNESNLYAMENFLKRKASLWLNISLKNPIYKNVQIRYDVQFYPGVNPDYGYRKLQEALEAHYMPWGVAGRGEVRLNSVLDFYDVIFQIQSTPWVSKVLNLTLDGRSQSVLAADDEVLVLVWA